VLFWFYCKVNLLFTFVIFIYKGQQIDLVVSDNCLIHVKEFQKRIAVDTLTAVREVSKQYRYETSTVLMLGHAGQLSRGPTNIGSPC
jgi:hypothetical protein